MPAASVVNSAAQPASHASVTARKPAGRAADIQGSARAEKKFSKSGKKRGPSVEYKPLTNGIFLTDEFVALVESQFDRLVHRRDPRKIIRAISKRTGATEEAVAHILLVGKLTQYRAENREFRRWIAEGLPRVAQAGEAAWKRRVA